MSVGCMKCRHFESINNILAICKSPKLIPISISSYIDSNSCRDVKILCGQEAKWFEPKTPKILAGRF